MLTGKSFSLMDSFALHSIPRHHSLPYIYLYINQISTWDKFRLDNAELRG